MLVRRILSLLYQWRRLCHQITFLPCLFVFYISLFLKLDSHIIEPSPVYKNEFMTYSGKTLEINNKYIQTKVSFLNWIEFSLINGMELAFLKNVAVVFYMMM